MLAQVKTYSPWDVACICLLKPLPVCWCSPPIHRDSIKHFGLGMPFLSLNFFFFGACFGVSFCFTMLKNLCWIKDFEKYEFPLNKFRVFASISHVCMEEERAISSSTFLNHQNIQRNSDNLPQNIVSECLHFEVQGQMYLLCHC